MLLSRQIGSSPFGPAGQRLGVGVPKPSHGLAQKPNSGGQVFPVGQSLFDLHEAYGWRQRPKLQVSSRAPQQSAAVEQVRPLLGMQVLPQATKLAPQVNWQAPSIHSAVAFSRRQAVQEVPQASAVLVPG